MRAAVSSLLIATPLFAVAIQATAVAEVPIQIAMSGHGTVPVEGDFGVRQFVLDTGAEGSAVYEAFSDSAGFVSTGHEALQGQTGRVTVPIVRINRLTLDGVSRGPIDVLELPDRADGVPIAGIVGLDVFGDRTLDFDLPRMRATLLPPGVLPKGLKRGAVHATPIEGGLLTIPVQIGSVTATAVIDTGARKTRINWALGHLLGLNHSTLDDGETIMGATNQPTTTSSAVVQDVRLGDRVLANAPVLVADVPVFEAFGLDHKPAVILGLDWLNSTRLVIDFTAPNVWFESVE